MLRTILSYCLTGIGGIFLASLFRAARNKWPGVMGLFQRDKLREELSEDRNDLQLLLENRNKRIEELEKKDERREIAFEELFEQVQGYRLVRDRLQGTVNKANVRIVALQQELDIEGLHTSVPPGRRND